MYANIPRKTRHYRLLTWAPERGSNLLFGSCSDSDEGSNPLIAPLLSTKSKSQCHFRCSWIIKHSLIKPFKGATLRIRREKK